MLTLFSLLKGVAQNPPDLNEVRERICLYVFGCEPLEAGGPNVVSDSPQTGQPIGSHPWSLHCCSIADFTLAFTVYGIILSRLSKRSDVNPHSAPA